MPTATTLATLLNCSIVTAIFARIIGGDDGFFGFVAVVDRFEFKLPIGVFKGRENALGISSACAGPLRAATFPKMILSFDTPSAARSRVLQKARAAPFGAQRKDPNAKPARHKIAINGA